MVEEEAKDECYLDIIEWTKIGENKYSYEGTVTKLSMLPSTSTTNKMIVP
jgi:hypothetical protein